MSAAFPLEEKDMDTAPEQEQSDSVPADKSTHDSEIEAKELEVEAKEYCAFYQAGTCRFGDGCFKLHEADPSYVPSKKKQQKKKKKKKPSEEEEGDKMCDKCKKSQRKMRTVMDVVHRIQWDEQYDPEHFLVGFLDRFDGIVEEDFKFFDWSDVTTVDDWESFCIPKHRVYYFKQNGEIIWDRRTRLDLIFEPKRNPCNICNTY